MINCARLIQIQNQGSRACMLRKGRRPARAASALDGSASIGTNPISEHVIVPATSMDSPVCVDHLEGELLVLRIFNFWGNVYVLFLKSLMYHQTIEKYYIILIERLCLNIYFNGYLDSILVIQVTIAGSVHQCLKVDWFPGKIQLCINFHQKLVMIS